MKKLLLVLVLFAVTLSVSAQKKIPIKSYLIGCEGSSNGLTIDSNFVVDFVSIFTTATESKGWRKELGVITYTDTTCTQQVFNDSIPYSFIYYMPKHYRDSTMRKGMKKFIGKRLKQIYGSDNVTVLN